MRDSGINWTRHTFNPWQGCSKVSPGCKRCYAEAIDKRNLQGDGSHWGPGAPRKVMPDAYWEAPIRWNEEAAASGERTRVFCASMADIFDSEGPGDQRVRLWELIRKTPALDWLLLTKRPENILTMLPDDWGQSGYANVWMGTSVEDRKYGLPRIDILRTTPAAVRFLSVEPLLEDLGQCDLSGIQWAIVGGESGNGARSMDTKWVENILEQCKEQSVAAWVKQMGKSPLDNGEKLVIIGQNGHNGEMMDWPEHLSHLRVRELPVQDRDQVEKDLHKAALGRVEDELGKLAAALGPKQTEAERELRTSLIAIEHSIFCSRQVKGQILADYKALYLPLRKWAEFLRVIEMPRQTAYDLIHAYECTESVHLPDESGPNGMTAKAKPITTELATRRINGILAQLDEAGRSLVLERLYDMYAPDLMSKAA